MAFLPSVLGIEKADGTPADELRSDGTRAPLMMRLGAGLISSFAFDGGIGRVLVAAVLASSTSAGMIPATTGPDDVLVTDGAGVPHWVSSSSIIGGVTLYATRADLRAADKPAQDGTLAFVNGLGVTIPFRWNATSTTTDDGFTILTPDAGGAGRWLIDDRDLDVRYCDAVVDIAAGGDPIQTALDIAVLDPSRWDRVYIPRGVYHTTHATMLYKSGGYIDCTISSDTNAFENLGTNGGAIITWDDGSTDSKNQPVFLVQGSRAVTIDGIGFVGPNLAPYTLMNVGFVSLYSAAYVDWISAGIRTNPYSPQCPFAIDPFCNGNPGGNAANMHPGLETFYDAGAISSSNVKVRNCWFRGGVVGAALSYNGITQNCEDVHFDGCRFQYNRTGFGIGQGQARNVTLTRCGIANQYFGISSKQLADGNGQVPALVQACNIGGTRYMFDTDLSTQLMVVQAVYCESTCSLGRLGASNSGTLLGALVTGCNFTFLSSQTTDGAHAYPEVPFVVQTCGSTRFSKCGFTHNSTEGITTFDNQLGFLFIDACEFTDNARNNTHAQVAFTVPANVVASGLHVRGAGGAAVYQNNPMTSSRPVQETMIPAAPGTNCHAQFNTNFAVTSGFTVPFPRRTVQVVMSGGTGACTITIKGHDPSGRFVEEDFVHAGGAHTFQGIFAYEDFFSMSSSVNPGGTVDVQAGKGFALGGPFASFDVLGVNDVVEAASSSDTVSGTVVPTTAPDGSKRFATRVRERVSAYSIIDVDTGLTVTPAQGANPSTGSFSVGTTAGLEIGDMLAIAQLTDHQGGSPHNFTPELSNFAYYGVCCVITNIVGTTVTISQVCKGFPWGLTLRMQRHRYSSAA